ncbi:carbohydrate ABC transporter permease [Demequina sediminicola]|uniref:carbohydrate ABC transporter permease n=1 Tax=Demequina sediminicola TaxID=1095026 RepID=UPI0009E42467|nr:carbohydrate ABC transporter permease [Demequina sediminicola]
MADTRTKKSSTIKVIRSQPARPSKKRLNVAGGVLSFVWLAVVAVPLYWLVITSFRTQATFFTDKPLALPSDPTLDNYQLVLENDFWRYLANSAIVTIVATVLIVACAFLAAYAIARNGRGVSKATFSVLLLGLAIPLQATIIPVYLLIVEMGLYDTLIAVILPSAAFGLPIAVLILVNFLRDIPPSLFEAARLDGASEWRAMLTVALPLARPALATVAIYSGLNVWNGFLFPLILTQSEDKRVLPLALTTYQGLFTINVPAVVAAVVLSSLPVIALYILGRRQLLAGMTAGFGK